MTKTKFCKFIAFTPNVLYLAIGLFVFCAIWYFARNWILDLSALGFMIAYTAIMCAILFIANGANLQIRKFAVALAMFLTIAMLVIMAYTYSIYEKRQVAFYPNGSFFTFKAKQPLITLGESWCYFKDYKGNICENYVIYVEERKQKRETAQI